MKWFRMYSSVLDDPKAQRLPGALFKHWVNLLCLANQHEPRGELPPLEDIAFRLRVKPSEAKRIIQRLVDARLIDVENTSENRRTFPHNWTQRQRASDDISTRVADHRKRKARNTAESEQVPIGNVTLHVTKEKRRVDTDTEKDTEENISLSGKVSNNSVVVDAPERAAAASGAAHTWTDAQAGKIARRLAGILHMVNPNLDGLMAVIKQYPNAQAWLEAQAAGCFEYYDEQRPKRKVNIRLFDNWLKRDENRRGSVASSSAQQPLAAEKVLSNGHTTPDAQPPVDALYEFNAKLARAKLVS